MKYINGNHHKHVITVLSALTLAACGGGGGSQEGTESAAAEQAAVAAPAAVETTGQNTTAATVDSGNAQVASSGTASETVSPATADDVETLASVDSTVIEATGDVAAPAVDIDETDTSATPAETAPATTTAAAEPTTTNATAPTLLAETTIAPAVKETFDGTTMTGFGNAVLDEGNVYLVSGKGVNGSKALKVNYVGNSQGSQRVIVNYKLPRALKYTLNFDVNFCSGFDFRKGGKLHGLGPANPVAGGNDVTSARWSARGMFRSLGGLQSYVYSQNMASQYGDVVIAKDFHFQPGRYYAITYQVALNNPATYSNGYMKVFVDGVEIIYHKNIKFRSTESLDSQIQTLMFNTFHGGNSSDWAPRNADGSYATDCAYYDNFAAYPALRVRTAPGL